MFIHVLLCMYMRMYVCMHIHTHKCRRMHVNAHPHIYTFFVCVYVDVMLHVRVYVCMCADVWVYASIYISVYTYVAYVSMFTCMYICCDVNKTWYVRRCATRPVRTSGVRSSFLTVYGSLRTMIVYCRKGSGAPSYCVDCALCKACCLYV
jgi:hypothetical protein